MNAQKPKRSKLAPIVCTSIGKLAVTEPLVRILLQMHLAQTLTLVPVKPIAEPVASPA